MIPKFYNFVLGKLRPLLDTAKMYPGIRDRVGYKKLRHQRFLRYATEQGMLTVLTEVKFRERWELTDKSQNEVARFKAIIESMRNYNVAAQRRSPIGAQIKQAGYADGKWHRVDTIAEKLRQDPNHVEATIEGVIARKSYGLRAERKLVGKHYEYRMFRQDVSLSRDELREKVSPILNELKKEGRKTTVTMSPPVVLHLTIQLERLVDEWLKQ